MMRYFLLSSLVVLLAACANEYKSMQAVSGDPVCVEKFRPAFTSQLYKANVAVTGKTLSGLLLFKAMPDSSTRVVFSTETGFKFFDFSFGGPQPFKAIYVMKKLDKKVVVEALQQDFELLLMQPAAAGKATVSKMSYDLYYGFSNGPKTRYYITDSICHELQFAELAAKRKKLVRINQFAISDRIPDSIYIQHFNFNFTISLKKLER
jgi:hypothetical protein